MPSFYEYHDDHQRLGVLPANKTERLEFITSWIHNQPDIFTSLLNLQPNSVEIGRNLQSNCPQFVHHNESQSNAEQSTEDNLIASVEADIENNDDSLPGSKDKPLPRKLTYNPHHKYQTQSPSKKTTSSESLFSSSMTPRVPLSLSKHRREEIICRFFSVNAEDMASLCVKNAVGTAT